MCVTSPNLPLVSLVILTCNRPGFLRLALTSASAQTYSNIEAVVVDDGSRHVTRSLLRDVRVPVKYVRMASRASIGAKRNAGMLAAHGAVIVHWDDVWIRFEPDLNLRGV